MARPAHRLRGTELERLRARRRHGALGVQRLAGRDLSLGGEVRDPGRALPRAIVGGTLAVVVIYLLANAAYLRVLPIEEIARSPLVAADMAVRLFGPTGSALIAALVCVSTFGALNAGTMAIPRVFWAMADDGLFFRTVAAVHPRYRTPHVAIVSLAGLAIIYLLFRSFEQLIEASCSRACRSGRWASRS